MIEGLVTEKVGDGLIDNTYTVRQVYNEKQFEELVLFLDKELGFHKLDATERDILNNHLGWAVSDYCFYNSLKAPGEIKRMLDESICKTDAMLKAMRELQSIRPLYRQLLSFTQNQNIKELDSLLETYKEALRAVLDNDAANNKAYKSFAFMCFVFPIAQAFEKLFATELEKNDIPETASFKYERASDGKEVTNEINLGKKKTFLAYLLRAVELQMDRNPTGEYGLKVFDIYKKIQTS